MNEHYQRNTTLREENVELTTKLKGLIEQYELREQVSRHYLLHFTLVKLAYLPGQTKQTENIPFTGKVTLYSTLRTDVFLTSSTALD